MKIASLWKDYLINRINELHRTIDILSDSLYSGIIKSRDGTINLSMTV